MGTGYFPGVKRPGLEVDHPPQPSAGVLLHLWAFVAHYRATFTFTFTQNYSFFILCIEFHVACVQTEIVGSCQHHTKPEPPSVGPQLLGPRHFKAELFLARFSTLHKNQKTKGERRTDIYIYIYR